MTQQTICNRWRGFAIFNGNSEQWRECQLKATRVNAIKVYFNW